MESYLLSLERSIYFLSLESVIIVWKIMERLWSRIVDREVRGEGKDRGMQEAAIWSEWLVAAASIRWLLLMKGVDDKKWDDSGEHRYLCTRYNGSYYRYVLVRSIFVWIFLGISSSWENNIHHEPWRLHRFYYPLLARAFVSILSSLITIIYIYSLTSAMRASLPQNPTEKVHRHRNDKNQVPPDARRQPQRHSRHQLPFSHCHWRCRALGWSRLTFACDTLDRRMWFCPLFCWWVWCVWWSLCAIVARVDDLFCYYPHCKRQYEFLFCWASGPMMVEQLLAIHNFCHFSEQLWRHADDYVIPCFAALPSVITLKTGASKYGTNTVVDFTIRDLFLWFWFTFDTLLGCLLSIVKWYSVLYYIILYTSRHLCIMYPVDISRSRNTWIRHRFRNSKTSRRRRSIRRETSYAMHGKRSLEIA